MKLIAKVRHITGRSGQYLGIVKDGIPQKLTRIADPSQVVIEEDPHGYFLFREDSGGTCLSDSWFPTLAEAKHQAEVEFGVTDADWEKCSSSLSD